MKARAHRRIFFQHQKFVSEATRPHKRLTDQVIAQKSKTVPPKSALRLEKLSNLFDGKVRGNIAFLEEGRNFLGISKIRF
jgi:hypothetical protein